MNPDAQRIERILRLDPVWAAYALADLQPAFAADCTWTVGGQAGREGLVLLYAGLQPPILLTVGDPQGVAAALEAAPLPAKVCLSVHPDHAGAVLARYDHQANNETMWRMVLADPAAAQQRQAAVDGGVGALVRLGPADGERIQALLAQGGPFTPDAFHPAQLAAGIFCGVESAGGDLLAMGGTHIVDWQAGIAAVGNMYTHPAWRGRGLGSWVLTSIVQVLTAGGVGTIILNVDQRNTSARRLYEQLGFVVHCPFVEGVAEIRTRS